MKVISIMKRDTSFLLGKSRLDLPVFFPSISSVKNSYDLEYYLQVASQLIINKAFLVSAYDVAFSTNMENAQQLLDLSKKNNTIIMLDSGNYESYWKDKKNIWLQSNYHEILKTSVYDIAFSFDDQNPSRDNNKHIEQIIASWQKDQQNAGLRPVIPIIHGTSSCLPLICRQVADYTSINMIAVPERALGDDIFSRAKTVKAIRQELDMLDRYVSIHLLGTGNPISIAIYTVQGAESFDGLEWCQTVVDHKSGFLHHYSHSEFFKQQTLWADYGLSFHVRTLAHNLEFYSNWISQLQTANVKGLLLDFCEENLPDYVFEQCIQNLGWERNEHRTPK